MKTIIGIDPGANGGICISDVEAHTVTGFQGKVGWSIILSTAAYVALHNRSIIYLEKVHAMPFQGVTSMFHFGENYGFIQGYLTRAGVSWVSVTPQAWQKALGLIEPRVKGLKLTPAEKAKLKTEKKLKMLSMAEKLYPAVFKGLNKGQKLSIADAVLIAHYGHLKEKEAV